MVSDSNENTFVMQASLSQIDKLIFLPHPDDEALACGGLIINARMNNENVKIVFFTNGDSGCDTTSIIFQKNHTDLTHEDYRALGYIRQKEALAAANIMGLDHENVIFLGYPDGELTRLYENISANPCFIAHTKLNHTYGPLKDDYHSTHFGAAGYYNRQSVLDDVSSLINTYRPKKIYVPAEFDMHPDHKSVFWFVRDAIKITNYSDEIFIYLVHGGNNKYWPYPRGTTPLQPMAQYVDESITLPLIAPWPPSIRLSVNQVTNDIKLRALNAHESQLIYDVERDYLNSFIKNEEIFWQIDPLYYPNW